MAPRGNPDQTRTMLLEAAFREIHRSGFRAASLDAILADTGVTKGALYHHFPNKTELGYAVVDLVGHYIDQTWVEGLRTANDPVQFLIDCGRSHHEAIDEDIAKLGCPLNNLTQEMSSIDEGFRNRLFAIIQRWTQAMADAFRRGQANRTVRPEVDVDAAAAFIVSSIEGLAGTMKNAGSKNAVKLAMTGLEHYLLSLRPLHVAN